MNSRRALSLLFYVAAAYDGLLGALFLVAPEQVFERFGVTPPNHYGYLHFPALLLLTFAIMFFRIARDPAGRRELIPYGMMLKISYCTVVFGHWAARGIPGFWKPFAWADLVFLAAFAWAYAVTRPRARTARD